MGTWGTAILSNDTSADVKGEYIDLLGEGTSGPDATDRLIERYRPHLLDAEDFYLGLAATQFSVGRLEDRVRDRALALMDEDLERWEGASRRAREKALAKLRDQLTGPQRPEKRIRRRVKPATPFEHGDLLAYRLPSGREIPLTVTRITEDRGGRHATVAVHDWDADELPRVDAIAALPVRNVESALHDAPANVTLWASKRVDLAIEAERVRKLGSAPETKRVTHSWVVGAWSELDGWLDERYGLR